MARFLSRLGTTSRPVRLPNRQAGKRVASDARPPGPGRPRAPSPRRPGPLKPISRAKLQGPSQRAALFHVPGTDDFLGAFPCVRVSTAQALGVVPHQETGVAPGQPSQRAFILGLLPFAF
jgi:hypothetical protein